MRRPCTLPILLVALLPFGGSSVFAQAGSMDPTFNPVDQGSLDGFGAGDAVQAIAVQSDGKILITGDFALYNGGMPNKIARLNVDGKLDTTFHSATGSISSIHSVAVQADGKVLIGGIFTDYNGVACNNFLRLNGDGSLDTSFNVGTGVDGDIRSIAVLPDGKILLAGYLAHYNDNEINDIARLNADGSLDTSFDPGIGPNGSIRSMVVRSDGKILIGGFFTSISGADRGHVARLNADGSLDSGFDPGTGANGVAVFSVSAQSDGKVVIGGDFTSYDGTERGHIARLNEDGSLDGNFDPGTGTNYQIYSSAIRSNGKILIAGQFSTFNSIGREHVALLNADGSLDTDFDPGSGADGVTNGDILSIYVQLDGKFLIGGEFTIFNGVNRGRIERLNVDGSRDVDFNRGTGPDNGVRSMAVQPNGKILIGGDFTSYNGTPRRGMARLNADGNVDTSFDPGTGLYSPGGSFGHVSAIMLLPDGKILIGGAFGVYNGTPIGNIARLNPDGSLDAGFNAAGAGAYGEVSCIVVQSDGKILIGGSFISFNGTNHQYLARLNADGSLDSDFNPVIGGYNQEVYSIVVQPDGKILIGGYFTSCSGTACNSIARLNVDGSFDGAFDTGAGAEYGTGAGYVHSILVQPDGKILIAGIFDYYNGYGYCLVRLNTDGSTDASFNFGAFMAVTTLSLQPDGKILIGHFGSSTGPRRLNTDGSLDSSFDPGIGTQFIDVIVPQSVGKVLIGGGFKYCNGIGRNYVARILDSSVPSEVVLMGQVNPCVGIIYDVHVQSGPDVLPALDTTLQTGPDCSYSLNYYPTTPSGYLHVTTSCDNGLTFISDSAFFNFNLLNIDTVHVNLACGGGSYDCNGLFNGPAMPGTPCDDGDVLTINDTWDVNCFCSGTVPSPCQAMFYLAQAVGDDSLPTPNSLWLYNTSNGGSGAYTYSWDFGDGFTSTEDAPVHSYTGNGPYWLCLSINDGLDCTDTYCDSVSVDDNGIYSGVLGGGGTPGFTINVIDQTTLDITELHSASGLNIWPNPASDILNVRFVSGITGASTIAVIDLDGRVVRSQAIDLGVGRNQLAIPMGELSDGLYLLRIGNASGYMSQRFVKTH